MTLSDLGLPGAVFVGKMDDIVCPKVSALYA